MPADPSAGSGSALSEVERADRRSQIATLVLALVAAVSIWLSAGIVAVLGGDTHRVAALPSISILGILAVALPLVAWLARLRPEHLWPVTISLVLWLPFLPAPAPASFFLWEGPIEVIVWLVVIAGLIVARPPKLPSAFSNQALAPWMAGAIVAMSALMVFSQVRNVIPGGDEPHYLAATQSLLHDADLKVANNYERGEYLDYFPGRLEPHFLKRSTSGDIYSIHAPGVSVIVLPAFAIAGYAGAVWTMILFAALTGALIWRVAFDLSDSFAAAWIAVCGVCFSAPFFFHTFTIYPEVIGAFCVIAGAWLLVKLADGHEVSEHALVAVGTALAVMPWLHSRFAVIAGIAGLLIAARLAARSAASRRIGVFLAIPAVAAVAWFAFFYVIWGSPSPTAPYGPDTSTSASYILRGLIGLLFDQQFGVVTTAPIYVMAAIGGVALFQSRPRVAIELAMIVFPYAIAAASYAMWWGGAAAPGRFVVAILPLAALPLAAGYARSQSFRMVAIVLVIVSTALLIPRAFEDSGRFIYNNRSGVDATARWLATNVDLAAALPSVHRSGGWVAMRDAAIWLAGFAAVVAGVRRMRRRNAGASFALVTCAITLAVMICARVAWAFDGFTPIDGLRSNLSVVDRLRPQWQSIIIELPSLDRMTVENVLNRLPITMQASDFWLERVPAGEYVVWSPPSSAAPGSLRIAVGRNDGPVAQASLDDLRNVHTPFRLRLPVMARLLHFRVDPPSDLEFTLRPVGLITPAFRQGAIRAARYGHSRAFFFDELLYPERDGFWTRAHGSSTVVIDTDEGTRLSGLPISVTAGAVATTVTLAMGEWAESLTLAAGQKQDVMLPPARDGAWTLNVRSGPGFRPSQRDPGNRDVRELAAWIAIY